ncbi:hypothetical protein EON64_11695 [archaeon]|nr:MAG: hypothetical protein EON64_11695 [archaeon]
MSTGVQTSDEAVAVFRVFKAAKNSDLFAIFRIADGKIVHEHTGSSETSFQDFMSLLPDDDCRYVAFKANYTTTDGRPATKIANISW